MIKEQITVESSLVTKMDEDTISGVRRVLSKPGPMRSYDDIVVLKAYISKLDCVKGKFQGLNPKQINDLCRNMELETFSLDNPVVFHQGDHGDKLYIVLVGKTDIIVKHNVTLAHGESEMREKVVMSCVPGMHFGERALDHDEPRGATVVCVMHTELITVSKAIYVSVLKDRETEASLSSTRQDKAGSKAYVCKALATSRDQRTKKEIEHIAEYLLTKLPFFANFNLDSRMELARVAEYISIWGKQILFKQGQTGKAFYVVLTGSVEVWVMSPAELAASSESGSVMQSSKANVSITDGLGSLVSTIPTGATFGERAMENEGSIRMASVVTCDNQTELLVISKEDYLNLIQVMVNKDAMEKVRTLRRTQLLADIEVVHLSALAKFMEKKYFHLNEVLYSEGDKINELLIVVTGECKVSMVVDQYITSPDEEAEDGITTTVTETVTAATTATSVSPLGPPKKVAIDLGRIGPFSILGTEMAIGESFHVDIIHTETVRASSLVVVYSIAKNDFFYHLKAETRSEIMRLAKESRNQLLPHLWDTTPTTIGEMDWKIATTWQRFRKALAADKSKSKNILVNMRSLDGIHFGGPDLGDKNKELTTSSTSTATAASSELYNTFGIKRAVGNLKSDNTSSSMTQLQSLRTNPFITTTMELNAKREALASKKEMMRLKELERSQSVDSLTQTSILPAAPLIRHPFVLIHVHREPVKARGGLASRRLVSCHLRICGTQTTCAACKDSAAFQMKAICLAYYKGDPLKEQSLALKWRTFSGYDNMPLQHTDHFMIYCRNAPLEYASLTISEETLSMKMPAACRPRGQVFCCVSMRPLRPPGKFVAGEGIGVGSDVYNDSGVRNRVKGDFDMIGLPETSEFVQENSKKQIAVPLFMMELSVVDEVLAASSSFIDCLRFAHSISPQPYPIRVEEASGGAMGGVHERADLTNSNDGASNSVEPRGSGAKGENMAMADIGDQENIEGRDFASLKDATSAGEESTINSLALRNIDKPRLCIVPICEWFIISPESLKGFDVESMSSQAIEKTMGNWNKSKQEKEMMRAFSEAHLLSDFGGQAKEAALSKAKKSDTSGLNGTRIASKNESQRSPKKEFSSLLSLRMLEREVERRELAKEVNRHVASSSDKRNNGGSLAINASMVSGVESTISGMVPPVPATVFGQTAEERIKVIRGVIGQRERVLQLNDNLCTAETGGVRLSRAEVERKQEKDRLRARGEDVSSSDEDEEAKWSKRRHKKKVIDEDVDEEAAGMGLLKQRSVMFDALNYLPSIKNATDASVNLPAKVSNNKGKSNSNGLSASNLPHHSPVKASLSSKLDVLDDMLLKFKLFAEKK